MKLSVNVEADAINVLALNMGRIVVDIDGIELTDLIDVVCDNGYSLRVADIPGKQVIEDPLPLPVRLPGICCSTAHITWKTTSYWLKQTPLAMPTGYTIPATAGCSGSMPDVTRRCA